MAENRISDGKLVTLVGATAASNIAGGCMVAVNTAANTIYSYSRDTAGLSGTAGAFGMRFIGILDEDVSAGQSPVTVWTDGVFRLRLQLGNSGTIGVGEPVYAANSGGGLLVSANSGGAAGNPTGMFPVGTVVAYGISGTAGDWLDVKITPGAFRWGGYRMNATTGLGNEYPPTL